MRYLIIAMLLIGCSTEAPVEPEPKVYDTIAPTDKPIDSTIIFENGIGRLEIKYSSGKIRIVQ